MDKEKKKEIENWLGKDKAKVFIQKQVKCDKYLIKFKQEMNELLKEHGVEVLCGIAYHQTNKE